MKQLITIALGVALGIAGYVVVNRYLHTHSATVVVQSMMEVITRCPQGQEPVGRDQVCCPSCPQGKSPKLVSARRGYDPSTGERMYDTLTCNCG